MAQYKNIDIVPDETITRVHLSQGDIGRTLIFYLFENALSWSVPASSTIKCQGTKPSGFGFSVSCTYSGNAVTCVTTEEMTDEFGQIEAELVITSSDESQIFGTSNFILDIEKNPHPASTEDGNVETAIALTARVEALETAVSELEASEGLTDAIKLALLQIAQKVAYIDDDGQDYYDDLYDALYPPAPPATLTSISAVYTQSGTVYDTDSLDSLKTDLVVTAHYDDSSSEVVATYTLSGTLTAGTSTITVSYGGKSTTFSVTVTSTILYQLTNHDTDGANDEGIATNINLLTTDTTFTIVGEITREQAVSKVAWRLICQMPSASPWDGLLYSSSNATNNSNPQIKWISQSAYPTSNKFTKDFYGVHRFVFRHVKESGTMDWWISNDGATPTTGTITCAFSTTNATDLDVCGVPDVTTWTPNIHVNQITVHSIALTNTEITSFLAGE